jgi:hypothetical protein
MLREGGSEKVVNIAICTEGGRSDEAAYPFAVVEEEYKLMGYYKRFKSEKEYREYDEERRQMRDYYAWIRVEQRKQRLEGEPLMAEQKKWLTKACDWNNKWGEMYTPQDIRRAVEEMMGDVEPGTALWWKPFKIYATTRGQLGEINHYKQERERADG